MQEQRRLGTYSPANSLEDREHELLTALLQVSGLLITVVDFHGRIILFNRACEQLTGWGFVELQDRCIWDVLVSPEERPAVKAVFDALVAGDFPGEHENYWLAKDGRRHWIHWKNTALVDVTGAVQYVIATGIDISERKRVEEALNEAHQFNQAILETAVDGIICIDAQGHIAVFNPAAEAMFGYPAAEVLGSNINLLMPDPFRSEHDHYLRRYAQTGVKQIIGSGREVVGRRKDGSLFPLDLAVGEIPLPGKQAMFAGMVRDITQRKLAEQEAKRRLDELAQVSRLSLMGEMASGLAHEINQPLAAIVNYAHACRRLLQAGRAEQSVLLDTLEQIARQGQRAGEIVSHLRQFIHRGKTERALADINAIVSSVIELLGHEIEAQRVELQLDLDGSLPPYAMDKIQIEQVILNLVKNAIDAMRAMAQDARRLHIQTRRHDGLAEAVEVIVRDTGEGLPAGEINRVFDPLFTTKPNGIGVGLSISRSIVHTHGGRLWAEPNPTTGACFHFTLPVVRGGLSGATSPTD